MFLCGVKRSWGFEKDKEQVSRCILYAAVWRLILFQHLYFWSWAAYQTASLSEGEIVVKILGWLLLFRSNMEFFLANCSMNHFQSSQMSSWLRRACSSSWSLSQLVSSISFVYVELIHLWLFPLYSGIYDKHIKPKHIWKTLVLSSKMEWWLTCVQHM